MNVAPFGMALGGALLLVALHEGGCSRGPLPGAADAAAPEVIRTANRLAANEGKAVIVDGLAVDVAGRAAIHLDRADAIVPVAGRAAWEAGLSGKPVRARGILTRHGFQNDPVTGIASLELREPSVAAIPVPVDGRIRTAPELHAAEGSPAEVEGMAYRGGNPAEGLNIVVVYGGLAYVRSLPLWNRSTVETTVVVRGTVRHPPLPFDAPEAGGSWTLDATGWEPATAR